MEQVIKQLYKLVNTLKVTEHVPGEAIEREIMLIRVNAEPTRRSRDSRGSQHRSGRQPSTSERHPSRSRYPGSRHGLPTSTRS